MLNIQPKSAMTKSILGFHCYLACGLGGYGFRVVVYNLSGCLSVLNPSVGVTAWHNHQLQISNSIQYQFLILFPHFFIDAVKC